MKKKQARAIGIDWSTSKFSCAVRGAEGKVEILSMPMRGAIEWKGQPGFDLAVVPGMILTMLKRFRSRGWDFSKGGALSLSVRQHDMVLLGHGVGWDNPLIPALSWQCNAATSEVAELRALYAERVVGRIEERFILAKLIWALRQDPRLSSHVGHVMTTGDFIACCLGAEKRLSTSDGLSNGLLNQKTKRLAFESGTGLYTKIINRIRGINFYEEWFPEPIQSGKVVGQIGACVVTPATKQWAQIRKILAGWKIVAGLGDNHAAAVGCGLEGFRTIVVSAGTSGTVTRLAKNQWGLIGRAACFEYYQNRLLLMMLHRCADWYEEFARWYTGKNNPDLKALDEVVIEGGANTLSYIGSLAREDYVASQTAKSYSITPTDAQFSLAVELLARVKTMMFEVASSDAPTVNRVVLTGGLSRSQFFQEVIAAGVDVVTSGKAKTYVGASEGPFVGQAATLGALINAMVGSGQYKSLGQAIAEMCPVSQVVPDDEARWSHLRHELSFIK